jgi:predicted nucleic acid-binding Zn ribbon protein
MRLWAVLLIVASAMACAGSRSSSAGDDAGRSGSAAGTRGAGTGSGGSAGLGAGGGSGAAGAAGGPGAAGAPAAGGSTDAAVADAGAGDVPADAGAGEVSPDALVSVMLAETPEAFRNPMKGFRPSRYIQDGAFPDGEYVSTYKHYVPYSALEGSAADGVQKIKDWSDTSWSGLRAQNRKVIPRVVIAYPGTGEYWGDLPHDGTPAEWGTAALEARLVAFVAKLGQAWDDDPRVAAVEMGLWGKWGEQNIYPDQVAGSDRIPAGFQQALGDAFNAAFKNKKVLVRYPDTFASDANVGFYWDSFALPDDDNAGGGAGIVTRDVWRTRMVSGEVAYDWGDQSHLGGSPDGTLSSNGNTDYVIGTIGRLHASSLGWIAQYTPDGGVVSANAARMQKAFGYRFTIKQATFNDTSAPGGEMDVSFTVENVGNAPFYYPWPIELSLLNADRSVAWRGTFDADVRQWLPGGPYTVRGVFHPGVADGTYTLAVAILDPAGNGPSLRFANTNYYRGGRTPLGRVGIGARPTDRALGAFDGLKSDASLSY